MKRSRNMNRSQMNDDIKQHHPNFNHFYMTVIKLMIEFAVFSHFTQAVFIMVSQKQSQQRDYHQRECFDGFKRYAIFMNEQIER